MRYSIPSQSESTSDGNRLASNMAHDKGGTSKHAVREPMYTCGVVHLALFTRSGLLSAAAICMHLVPSTRIAAFFLHRLAVPSPEPLNGTQLFAFQTWDTVTSPPTGHFLGMVRHRSQTKKIEAIGTTAVLIQSKMMICNLQNAGETNAELQEYIRMLCIVRQKPATGSGSLYRSSRSSDCSIQTKAFPKSWSGVPGGWCMSAKAFGGYRSLLRGRSHAVYHPHLRLRLP